ncbi:MAG TPA: DUF2277 domain-containing protein [Acidimicrobiales bacterium]|nr:DUF2277 domain-containing protein [Acidimicrobiales bacterium]
MCRSITTLRGLQPPATRGEIEEAALQYVRKVSGARTAPSGSDADFERAVQRIAEATSDLIRALPARRRPPPNEPPSRRIGASG